MLPLLVIFLATASLEPIDRPWGPDADLAVQEKPQPSHHSLASRACQRMIRFYQVYISPIDGPRSSFYPSSSQYTLEAIQKHGVLRGIARGCDRLLRENEENWVYDILSCDTDVDLAYDITHDLKLDPVR